MTLPQFEHLFPSGQSHWDLERKMKGTGFSLKGTGFSLKGTGFSLKGTGFSLKGTGFSPYMNSAKPVGL
jgi:hypothetical protein